MKVHQPNSLLFRAGLLALLVVGILTALVGCRGKATPRETAAREQAAAVRERFRPGDAPPTLPALTPESPLPDFLTYAVLRHPQVASAYYEWASTIERITIERSLPDPVFSAGVDIQKGMEEDIGNLIMMVMGGVMTELPGPGKLRARADLAAGEADVQFARFQEAALDAALEARRTYYEVFLLDERLRITGKNLEYVRDIEEAVRARTQAGLAPLQDILQVESERAQLETDIANLEDRRTALLAAWKSALGIAHGEPDPPLPTAFEFSDPTTLSAARVEEALAGNPRLRVMKAELLQAEAGVALAYKSRVPDFAVGLEAEAPVRDGSRNPRDTVWKPRVSVRVPIWRDKVAAEIAEAEAMKLARKASYDAEQLMLVRKYAATAFGLREVARNLAVLEETRIPAQRDIVALVRQSYQGGVASFFELINQQQRLLDLELMHAEARAERERLAAELSLALLGRPAVALSPAEAPR